MNPDEPELIVSQVVSDQPLVASKEEFTRLAEFPEDGPTSNGQPMGLELGVEKFRSALDKHYRLIWIGRGKACLAAEDTTEFRTKTRAVASGRELAAAMDVPFDERTR